MSMIYAAFRQCYFPGCVADIWPRLLRGEISPQEQADFIDRILHSGHTSPIEHVSFTFAVDGVSRSLTHQLVRHRMASYSQQSQRYVDGSHFSYILPPSIAANTAAKERFERCMDEIVGGYDGIKTLLEADGLAGAREDARFVLPQAAASALVVSMNCRGLLNFFEQRCCARAQWEIRGLALAMLDLCREKLPAIFNQAGAACQRLGYCPEGSFSCGKYPAK
jgi:thymidylate synthase (FAD)